MQDLFSVTPAPNWVMLTGKLLGVINMQIFLLAVFAVSGIILQLYSGYFHIEPWLYFTSLICIHLPGLIIWAMAAIFVHTWSANTFLGIFILIFFSLSIYQLSDIGIQSSLLRFNASPEPDFYLRYSDMNGYGHAFLPFLLYKSYWMIAGVILIIIAPTGWQREKIFGFQERKQLAIKRLGSYPTWVILLPIILLGGLGIYLYYQENRPENIIYTAKQEQDYVKSFEQKFKPFFSLTQPVITALELSIDLYPENQSFVSKGNYSLKNPGPGYIDTLVLKGSFNEITHYQWDNPVSVLGYDSIMQVILVKLSRPLAPQDSMLLHFTVSNKPNTLLTKNSPILENGTYLKSDFLPRLGWQPPASDSLDAYSTSHHYQGADEHGVKIQTTISTSADQVAFAPGSLEKEWAKGNRNYYTYSTDYPVKLVFGIISGRYKMHEERYKGIPIRIFYHPFHSRIITQFMEGVKASYDYNTQWFGPYLHKDIKIVAFARSQGTFASLSANYITVSETRFTQDTIGLQSSGTNLAFYVMAHELTHHWWGNQLLPADAPGANMLTESIAEYITTRIYENKFGKNRAMNFLRIQKNRYLSGIADAETTENSLVKVAPKEDYIAYGKGSIAFFSLSEKVGEANLNAALATWMQSQRGLQPPYPLASGLIHHLKLSLPPETQSLISGLFETAGAENMHNYVDWWKRDR
jgi:ABC-2 type transport system permease protein